MNIIRSELDNKKRSPFQKAYGIRKFYMSSEISTKKINNYYERALSSIRFLIVNPEEKKRRASTKTEAIRRIT